jgi:hypothetical protein
MDMDYAKYFNVNRKMKRMFHLLKKGHTLTFNEGTKEVRFINGRFEYKFLDIMDDEMDDEWHPVAPKNVEEEIIDLLQDQYWCFLIDQKDRISIRFKEVKFLWYNSWIGFYWDRKKEILYFCPFPMIVFCFYLECLTVWPHKN